MVAWMKKHSMVLETIFEHIISIRTHQECNVCLVTIQGHEGEILKAEKSVSI